MSKASRDDYTLLCAEHLTREIYDGVGYNAAELSDDVRVELGFAAKEAWSAIQGLRYILSKANIQWRRANE